MDNLTDIAVFVKVVESGSFTRTAEELELSRAVVSKYLSRLEERLGVRLLNRTTRRLSLTEAGAALYEGSRDALTKIEDAELAVSELQKEPRADSRSTFPYRSECCISLPRCLNFWPNFRESQWT